MSFECWTSTQQLQITSISMQNLNDLYLENSDALGDFDFAQYTTAGTNRTTNELSKTNEQRTLMRMKSAWPLQLHQDQLLQHVQQQAQQQTRLEMQRDHQSFMEGLFKDPEILYRTNRALMRSLSRMEAPEVPVLWAGFPTPPTAPRGPALPLDGKEIIGRPPRASQHRRYPQHRLKFPRVPDV